MNDLISNKLAAICPDPVIGVDREGTITVFNPAAEEVLGYSADEVIGKLIITELYHPPGAGREIKKLLYSDKLGGIGLLRQHEAHLLAKNGHVLPIQISATLIMEGDEEVGSIGFFHDMTRQKEFEQTLKTLSITDSLTGLYNQRHFHTILSQEVARCLRHGRTLSLICIDLDNFKGVNDSLGHLEGDNLLRYIGDLIADISRNNDHAFRYGGDEFMMLLPETNREKATHLAERLVQQFNSRLTPTLREHNLGESPVSLSIGVAEFNPGETPELFVKRADLAMYSAKRAEDTSIHCAD